MMRSLVLKETAELSGSHLLPAKGGLYENPIPDRFRKTRSESVVSASIALLCLCIVKDVMEDEWEGILSNTNEHLPQK
jgi:hypothetical protein